MSKTLEELGDEYEKEVAELDEKIERYCKRLKRANKTKNAVEIYNVQKLLCILYDERNEMSENARKLKNYYSE